VIVHADSPRDHIDVPVFRSALVTIGRWRCPADHRQYFGRGVASDALFVFPREAVWIAHEGGTRFVADANAVTYYNRGQHYRRYRLSARGDRCEWFAVAPQVIAETLALADPAAIDRPDQPFRFTHGPSDAASYLRQRMVFRHVTDEAMPDRLFVEETVLGVLAEVTRLAYAAARPAPPPRPQMVDLVEAARDVISRRFTEDLSLAEVASAVQASVFSLARAFRSRTGFSMHAYRNQLRLRAALERMRDPTRGLTDIAIDLGFSSHSHFTETFRRVFGRPPSLVRRLV
jgi:AraC-like DNA-binding protein